MTIHRQSHDALRNQSDLFCFRLMCTEFAHEVLQIPGERGKIFVNQFRQGVRWRHDLFESHLAMPPWVVLSQKGRKNTADEYAQFFFRTRSRNSLEGPFSDVGQGQTENFEIKLALAPKMVEDLLRRVGLAQ